MTIIIDGEVECHTKSSDVEIGDWAVGSYYNCYGDVRYKEGIVTDVLECDEE